ncbi:MAG: band-7 C-terminal domain-containing protein, partial [Alphaproteobacteria bacterium]
AMELQVAAERQKRAQILESEGKRQAQINMAEGFKQEVVLKSEAALTDQINRAKGEGEAILTVATATAEGLRLIAESLTKSGGQEAMNLRVAEQYVEAFKQLAQKSTTVLLPANTGDTASMVAQAITVFDRLRDGGHSGSPLIPPLKSEGPWGTKGSA